MEQAHQPDNYTQCNLQGRIHGCLPSQYHRASFRSFSMTPGDRATCVPEYAPRSRAESADRCPHFNDDISTFSHKLDLLLRFCERSGSERGSPCARGIRDPDFGASRGLRGALTSSRLWPTSSDQEMRGLEPRE
jgi:hypothetical protein